MSNAIPLSEAKAHLSALLDEVEHRGQVVVITRHGRRTAALVPADVVQMLERLRAARPQAGLAGAAGGWRRSSELADALDGLRRDAARAVRRR
jgi:prevent-host-death family protein